MGCNSTKPRIAEPTTLPEQQVQRFIDAFGLGDGKKKYGKIILIFKR